MTSPSLTPEKLLRWIIVLIRIGLGGIFLYAGAVKATASESFALALVPFSILPATWIGTFAVVLAWTEIAAGVLILLPKVHRLGAALILLLALTFIGVLTWALANDIIVSCGCFGQDETPSAAAMQMAILRDVGIVAAAAFALAFRPAADPGRDRSGSPGSGDQ
jgi:uncharacterized membrane protein YphA (DoxX/SURF4 family)